MKRKKIFRLVMKSKGEPIGYKLVEGISKESILRKPKSKFVGTGVKIIDVLPTKLKGTLKSRQKLPRSRRFGKDFY